MSKAPGKPLAEKLILSPDSLSNKDMRRARVMLGGRNPWEVLDEDDNRITLVIWCLKSRTNPDYTWEEADECPFSEFQAPDDSPPAQGTTQKASSRGSKPKVGTSDESSASSPTSDSRPNSASSTG